MATAHRLVQAPEDATPTAPMPPSLAELASLGTCAAFFQPADPPRLGRVAL